MPRRSSPGTLPIDAVARIVRATPSHLRQWFQDGPVELSQSGCSELDALKAALWRRLTDMLGPKPARLALSDVLVQLTGRLPTGRLDIVYDIANGKAQVCYTDQDLARAVLDGGLVHVVRMTEELERVRSAFRRHLTVEETPPRRGKARRPAARITRRGR